MTRVRTAICAGLIGSLSLLTASHSLSAETVSVSNPDALRAALKSAPSGAEIVLAPGDYGEFSITTDTAAAVIRSADPAQPARFTKMEVENVHGLTFEGLLFDYVFSQGDQLRERRFIWRDVTNLKLTNNIFDGDVAHGIGATENGYGFGFGLWIRNGENVVIEGNKIFNFWKGMNARSIEGLRVSCNEVYGVRSDGMNFVEVADVLVEANHIHNFTRSLEAGDHADMIQFWTNRTKWSSHDIVIRGNLLNAGAGWNTQSIFMRNERSDSSGSSDFSIFYRNILIEENVIINAHANAITVGDAVGVTVRSNTVIQNPEVAIGDPAQGRHIPRIRIAKVSRDVTITDNIVPRIIGYMQQPGWVVSRNLLLLGQSEYSRAFRGGAPADPASYRPRQNGPAAGLGASMLH